MTEFEAYLNEAKDKGWSWNLDALKAAQTQLQELRNSGGTFKAKDIHGKEQECIIKKDKEPTKADKIIETSQLRFRPIQLSGFIGQADHPGGKDCPIWLEKHLLAPDCKLENHIRYIDDQMRLQKAAFESFTFRSVINYLETCGKDARKIDKVVCFGITNGYHTEITQHSGKAEQRFQPRPYWRYLLCSMISQTLRTVLQERTDDPEKQLHLYIQGHNLCFAEKYLIETGFGPGDQPWFSDQEKADFDIIYKSGIVGGYPAKILEDIGGLLELNKNTFIISFDQRIPVRQIATQALVDDGGPAGMMCLNIVDDGTAADCQNQDGRIRDLSSPDVLGWKESCITPLHLPDKEDKFAPDDFRGFGNFDGPTKLKGPGDLNLFKGMTVYLKKEEGT